MYRRALTKGLVRGRPINGMVAASTYAACRLTDVPRSLSEIAKASGMSRKLLAHYYRALVRSLDVTMAIEDPLKRVSKISSRAGADSQTEMLAGLSPIHKLHRVKAALMVQHGANDTNVPVVEAEQIVENLKGRGVPVEYILFPDEGHGWRKVPNRVRSTTAMVDFFRRHLDVVAVAAREDARADQVALAVDLDVGRRDHLAGLLVGAQLRGGKSVRVVAVEPAACPSLTRGSYAYDFGDTGHMTPLARMHTLGSTFMPPGFHAGGLRYHGMAPLVSHLKELGLIEARAYPQTPCFEAGVFFARQEGIVPAPEAA